MYQMPMTPQTPQHHKPEYQQPPKPKDSRGLGSTPPSSKRGRPIILLGITRVLPGTERCHWNLVALGLDALRRRAHSEISTAGVTPRQASAEPIWGYPMTTELLIVIMSIVALHVAALLGGGLALGVMKLLGRKPPQLPAGDAAYTAH